MSKDYHKSISTFCANDIKLMTKNVEIASSKVYDSPSERSHALNEMLLDNVEIVEKLLYRANITYLNVVMIFAALGLSVKLYDITSVWVSALCVIMALVNVMTLLSYVKSIMLATSITYRLSQKISVLLISIYEMKEGTK